MRQPFSTSSLLSHSSSSGCVGGCPCSAEIVGGRHDPLAEKLLPDPVDRDSRDQGRGRRAAPGKPSGERTAAPGSSLVGRAASCNSVGVRLAECAEKPRRDLGAWTQLASPNQEVSRRRGPMS